MINDADLQFRQTEDIYRTLIEESPTPIGLYSGRDMIIRVANKTILEIWGKGNDVINRSYYAILPELEGQKIFKLLDEVFTTGITYQAKEYQLYLERKGELQKFYFNFTFTALKDANGKVWGIINTADDVTELVLTKQKLAESEELTRFALQAAESGTWNFNLSDKSIVWDERSQELFGFKKGAPVQYRDVLSAIHPDDIEYVKNELLQATDKDLRKPYDIKYRTIGLTDRRLRWINTKGKAYFNEDGSCSRLAGTIQDITREIADNEQQQKLIAVVENSAEVIGVSGMDAKVTYLNKAGFNLLGIDRDEDALQPGLAYFMPDDGARVYDELVAAIVKKGKWEGELHYRHFKTGEAIPVYLNAFRIDDPLNNKPMALASVARDLRPEKKARNEQDRLLSLINHSSDFVSLSDLDGKVTYINAAGQKMVGLEQGQIQRHNSEFLMPEEIDKLKSQINTSLKDHGKWSGQVNYRNFKTGEPIPVSGTTMLIYNAVNGEPEGRATIVRDLRREIADKKALVDSEHLLKNITAASPAALWMADKDGRIIYVNQTWIDWTGYSFEENLGDGWTKAILPEDRQRTTDRFLADVSKRKPYKADFRIKHNDGVRWCIATGNPQFKSDGTFAGYIGACIDATEKILADEQLRLKNEELNNQINEFEFVTNFMPVQLWTATTDGEIDFVNQRALDFFGIDADEIIGPKWLNLIHPEDHDDCIAAWTNSLQTGNLYQFEFRLRDKEGNYKWHLARALPFVNDGKIIKWFGTNTDINEQKQLQRQKDDFLGIASHELKTPVTSIKAYAQVLGAMFAKEGEHKKAEMVLRMDTQVNRLTNLIGDLLDVTKINSGRLQFNKTWFDLSYIIKETVEDLQHTTQNHKLILDLAETGQIFSDKDRISQVITNLITNAIKYSPLSDEIIINTKLEDDGVIVCVQDFGIGIPSDKADKVFEQFYRVSGNKQHTFPGLGLGLYISSEIIKREGGRMWVNSVEGKGSTFCFSLPVKIKMNNTTDYN